jgi:hypothetical protein
MPSDVDPEEVFVCQMCGECCRGYGGTYVSEADIRAIADYLQEDPERFKQRYCRRSGSRYLLGQSPSGYCIFWDTLCRIHPVKPRMCRNWPFIAAVLKDPTNWRTMAGSCPGMRTDCSDEAICRAVALRIAQRSKKPKDPGRLPDSENEA